MARRPLAGRDKKIEQGQRRDAFFAKMRRKGGVPRMPTQGMIPVAADEEPQASLDAEESDAAAEGEVAAPDTPEEQAATQAK